MRTRSLLSTSSALALLLAAAVAPRASHPPHWLSQATTTDCSSCHIPHNALGGDLNTAANNVNLCQSCHNAAGSASAMPLNNSDIASPSFLEMGTSHAFGVNPVNAAFGAASPAAAPMSSRLLGGRVVCSTCHDQHAANSADGGTPHISAPKKTTAFTSPLITSSGTYSGAIGVWYLVEISTGGAVGTARFRYSKDNGATWFASNLLTAASVALDSGVSVGFPAGTYVVNERYEFYGSWPFLRVALDSGDNATGAKMCRDCHGAWTMDYAALETFSGASQGHPVGAVLGANGRGYDRGVPLDGNGAAQGSGGADANRTNDLTLDATNRIQCYSCHGVHFADSNTTTQDGP